jgi:glucose-6-phosphate dehydrogenase assembly protein OpcA
MAESLIDRTWRPTTPDDIEPDLADLWREVGRQARVARAVMSNLVVVRQRPTRSASDAVNADAVAKQLPLDEVVAQHPSRVIVIQHDPDQQAACAPTAVSVGVLTFGPPHARYGVEEVLVEAACAGASLPSIVRRLLRGDVPTSVWWTDDLAGVPPLDGLVAMARQFVYDSRRWRDVRSGVQALARLHGRVDLADVNWRRLTPLRHALIHACRDSDVDHLRQAHVAIVHDPGESALAWLMIGWLSARLGWPASASPRISAASRADEIITISVGQDAREAALSGPLDLHVALNEHRVRVARSGGGSAFTVSVPQESEADAVAAELRNLGHDVSLRDVLGALLARLS